MATTKQFYIKRREGGKVPAPPPQPTVIPPPQPYLSIETMYQDSRNVLRTVFIENNPNMNTDRVEIGTAVYENESGGITFRNIVESNGLTFFTYKPKGKKSKPFGDIHVRGINGVKGILRQNTLLNGVLNDASKNGIYPLKKPLGFKRVFPDTNILTTKDSIDYVRSNSENDIVQDLSSEYFKDIYVLTYKISSKDMIELTYTYDVG